MGEVGMDNHETTNKISPALPGATLVYTGVNLVYQYLPGDILAIHPQPNSPS